MFYLKNCRDIYRNTTEKIFHCFNILPALVLMVDKITVKITDNGKYFV